MKYFKCKEASCYLQCRLECRADKTRGEVPKKCVVDGKDQEWEQVE